MIYIVNHQLSVRLFALCAIAQRALTWPIALRYQSCLYAALHINRISGEKKTQIKLRQTAYFIAYHGLYPSVYPSIIVCIIKIYDDTAWSKGFCG